MNADSIIKHSVLENTIIKTFELVECFIIVIVLSERIVCFIIEFAYIWNHVINLFHLTFVL